VSEPRTKEPGHGAGAENRKQEHNKDAKGLCLSDQKCTGNTDDEASEEPEQAQYHPPRSSLCLSLFDELVYRLRNARHLR
jgi:hypothetical protein